MEKKSLILSNGTLVTVRPVVTRKLMRDIQERTFKGVEFNRGADGKFEAGKFDIVRTNEVNDFSVMQMIESVVTNQGISVTVDQQFIDELPTADYDLILNSVNSVLYPNADKQGEAEKKS